MSIDLTTPIYLTPQATKIVVTKVEISNVSIQVTYSYKAADNALVKTSSIIITGADYQDLITSNITSGMVGNPMVNIMLKGIKQKMKTMLNIQGTVNAGF